MIHGAFEKAKRYIESHPKISDDSEKQFSKNLYPTITISRETGAGADVVSQILADNLQKNQLPDDPPVTIFDKNLIEKVTEDYNLPRHLMELIDENKYSAVASMAHELIGTHYNIWNLVRKTADTIYQLSQLGNVIIIGRGSNIICANLKNAVHVRLVAPIDYRIKHIRELYNMNRENAINYIKKEDLNRSKFITTYFNKKVEDLSLYHLVINTYLTKYEGAAKIIANIVQERIREIQKEPVHSF